MIYLLIIKAQSYIMKVNFCFTSLNIVKLLHPKKKKKLILRWFGGNFLTSNLVDFIWSDPLVFKENCSTFSAVQTPQTLVVASPISQSIYNPKEPQ